MVHVEALMELWRALYGPACSGDLDAVDRFLHVEERLSRLMALDLADHLTAPEPASPGDDDAANGTTRTRRFVRE